VEHARNRQLSIKRLNAISFHNPMPIQCIFCDNNSGSKEHLWPKWIHERKDFGPLNFQLGGSEKKVIPNPEITVKTVCGVCNNGWMAARRESHI
jgi:hypothetical protein